jgi:hypothetical protein
MACLSEILYCFAASLVLNSPVVYFLTAVGQNNRTAWVAVIAAEVLLLALLTRAWRGVRFVSVPTAEVPGEAPSFRSVSLAAGAVVTLLAFVPILFDNWGTVFISNDDLASWDRWAQDWFLNRFPAGTDLYTQLLPANWSITYALMRTADIKMFAKAMMPFFAVATLLLFVGLAWNLKDRVYLAGWSIAGFLFLQYLGRDFLITGYADVAFAFFCFVAFYVLYKEGSKPVDRSRGLFRPSFRQWLVFQAAAARVDDFANVLWQRKSSKRDGSGGPLCEGWPSCGVLVKRFRGVQPDQFRCALR